MKFWANTFLKPILKLYLRLNTVYKYRHLKLNILKGVFHPAFFFSSEFLADFVYAQELSGLNVLEPCCGSGLLSLVAYSKGANVTATDIDPLAVKNTELNFRNNFSDTPLNRLRILQTDIFPVNDSQQFDRVFINPPYFFKPAIHRSQWAWNAGEEGEFFQRFFQGLENLLKPGAQVYMVLADNCELEKIAAIATLHHFTFDCILQKKIYWEENYIYQIKPKHAGA